VPHFEKMLYDNAQLVSLYLHGYQVTKKPLYKRVVEETLEYVAREMTHSAGGFYSASDADSEGVEGKFFVWTPTEIDAVLNPDDAELAKTFWGVTEEGNFEESNILHVPVSLEDFVAESSREQAELLADIVRIRALLYAKRSKRIPPGIDDKILTSWNAMMLKAFAEAGAVLKNVAWIAIAEKNARLLLDQVHDDNGLLLHTWKATSDTEGNARILGYLEDHAFLVDALLTLYEATFNYSYVDEAQKIAEQMIERFWDPDWEVFYDTSMQHSKLLVRPRDILDNAVPSGGSVAAMGLQRLSVITGDVGYAEKAEASMKAMVTHMEQAPQAVTSWLSAVDFLTSNRQEVILIGDTSDGAGEELLGEARSRYSPNTVFGGSGSEPDPDEKSPLLIGRAQINGKPTAYVCENYACNLPVTSAAELADQLV
ncbi:MAG: thioredoxin domain-containing protein, partial [Rhodopirellula sp.]|nr:thioredoxin domain-containing protein [Rhodopirellula sp.]